MRVSLLRKAITTSLLVILSFIGLAQAPTITSFSPASGAIGTVVTINGTNLSNLTSLIIGGTPAVIVSNSNTSIKGMIMSGTTNGNISVYTSSGSVTSASSFSVIVNPIPNIQMKGFLYGGGTKSIISADGNTIVDCYLTAIGDFIAYPYRILIYNRTDSNASWIVDTSFNAQNASVSISADGKTIGIINNNGTAAPSIATIEIYKKEGNTWVKKLKTTTLGGVYTIQTPGMPATQWTPGFGGGTTTIIESVILYNVTLSADGNTFAALGTMNGQSAIWTGHRNNTDSTWQSITILNNPSDATAGTIISSISISADGKTLAVGGANDNGGIGATWIYSNINGTWSQQGNKIVGNNAIGKSNQGVSLALSPDGNSLVIGGIEDSTSIGTVVNAGAAWIFQKNGNSWIQDGLKLGGPEFKFDSLNQPHITVAISGDNNKVVIGNPSGNTVWIYKKLSGVWPLRGEKIIISNKAGKTTQLGSSTSISADGKTLLLGAPGSTENSNNPTFGNSLLFVLNSYARPQDNLYITSFTPTTGTEHTLVTITGSGFLGTTSVKFGNSEVESFRVVNDSTITTHLGDGATGLITINTPNGTAVSSNLFTYCGHGVSDGEHGGLESKSLGDAVGNRILNKAINSQLGSIDYTKYKIVELTGSRNKITGIGTSLKLNDILPKAIQNNNYKAYTTSPTDIPAITNATEVLSIDFTYQNKARAVAFATKTIGQVYDHTKAVCDRLKGSELLNIENVIINNINLVRFDLLNASGQKEFAYSFVIGAKNGRSDYTIQSTWLNKNYVADEVMYNIQLWAETPALITDMATDIITRLATGMPIREVVNNAGIPTTYITKGKRASENVVVDITNSTGNTTGYFEVMERENEYATNLITKQIPFTITANGKSTINIPSSDNYESTISMYINGVMKDQVFMADGNWGNDLNSSTTSIKSFKVSNDPKRIIENKDDFLLFRNMQVEANTQDYVTVYKLLRGGGAPQDLTGYKTFQFTGSATDASLNITLIKEGIANWSDQYSLRIPLSSKTTNYNISLDDFKSNGISNKIDPNDITSIVFAYEVANKGTNTLVTSQLSNLSFSKTDYTYLNSLSSKEINIYPNPASRNFNASFKSPIATSLNLVIREATSGRTVLNKTVNAVVGDNIVPISLDSRVGLANYILSLEGTNIKYNSKKVIITN